MTIKKVDFVEKTCTNMTLRILRIVCDISNYKILTCLPEREYHIMAKSRLRDDELNRRLCLMMSFDIIKKIGNDKYSTTPLGRQALKNISVIKPKVADSIAKRI